MGPLAYSSRAAPNSASVSVVLSLYNSFFVFCCFRPCVDDFVVFFLLVIIFICRCCLYFFSFVGVVGVWFFFSSVIVVVWGKSVLLFILPVQSLYKVHFCCSWCFQHDVSITFFLASAGR